MSSQVYSRYVPVALYGGPKPCDSLSQFGLVDNCQTPGEGQGCPLLCKTPDFSKPASCCCVNVVSPVGSHVGTLESSVTVEGPSIWRAFRKWNLTKGHRWGALSLYGLAPLPVHPLLPGVQSDESRQPRAAATMPSLPLSCLLRHVLL